jgi:hypothetical protein
LADVFPRLVLPRTACQSIFTALSYAEQQEN